jgi:hypothetical protein
VSPVSAAFRLATLARPFTWAEVEFYPEQRLEQAREWIATGKESGAA